MPTGLVSALALLILCTSFSPSNFFCFPLTEGVGLRTCPGVWERMWPFGLLASPLFLVLGYWLWLALGKGTCTAFGLDEACATLARSGALRPEGVRSQGPLSSEEVVHIFFMCLLTLFLALWVFVFAPPRIRDEKKR